MNLPNMALNGSPKLSTPWHRAIQQPIPFSFQHCQVSLLQPTQTAHHLTTISHTHLLWDFTGKISWAYNSSFNTSNSFFKCFKNQLLGYAAMLDIVLHVTHRQQGLNYVPKSWIATRKYLLTPGPTWRCGVMFDCEKQSERQIFWVMKSSLPGRNLIRSYSYFLLTSGRLGEKKKKNSSRCSCSKHFFFFFWRHLHAFWRAHKELSLQHRAIMCDNK